MKRAFNTMTIQEKEQVKVLSSFCIFQIAICWKHYICVGTRVVILLKFNLLN